MMHQIEEGTICLDPCVGHTRLCVFCVARSIWDQELMSASKERPTEPHNVQRHSLKYTYLARYDLIRKMVGYAIPPLCTGLYSKGIPHLPNMVIAGLSTYHYVL